MKGEITYYKILGVNENVSNHELRKAFCKLSIELHPDTTSLELEEAKNKFQKVLEAYENLNNSNLRKIYDEKLRLSSKNFKDYTHDLNTIILDSRNQQLLGNRRPFSNGWAIIFQIITYSCKLADLGNDQNTVIFESAIC